MIGHGVVILFRSGWCRRANCDIPHIFNHSQTCLHYIQGVSVVVSILVGAHLDESTVKVLERLAVFSINSGIWTALFSLLTAILVRTL